ncbi:MAG: hypothetical protein NT069_02640 [Planctomycetota bacterium]|nr:hypothetical protein [Planctomycetota bacterium]
MPAVLESASFVLPFAQARKESQLVAMEMRRQGRLDPGDKRLDAV